MIFNINTKRYLIIKLILLASVMIGFIIFGKSIHYMAISIDDIVYNTIGILKNPIVSILCLSVSFLYNPLYALPLIIFHLGNSFFKLDLYVRSPHYKGVSYWHLKSTDVAVITGGANGLGKVCATELSLRGVKVAVIDLEPITQRGIKGYKCDVSNKQQLLNILDEINKDFGSITILINNVAIKVNSDIMSYNDEEYENVFKINHFSYVWITRALLPSMMKQKRGFIVTISSVLGYISPANLSSYSASKAATIMFAESLQQEMKDKPWIRTLLFTPGQLNTKMFSDVVPPNNFLAPLVDVNSLGKEIVGMIERGITGEVSRPLYANFLVLIRCLPWWIQQLLRKLSKVDSSVPMRRQSNGH